MPFNNVIIMLALLRDPLFTVTFCTTRFDYLTNNCLLSLQVIFLGSGSHSPSSIHVVDSDTVSSSPGGQ